jgi:DNA-binding CsgD family transcriptional regulator
MAARQVRERRTMGMGTTNSPRILDGQTLVASDRSAPSATAIIASISGAVVEAFSATYGLSAQQSEVLRLTVSGLHAKEVADRLGCSRRTIDAHWTRIFAKTETNSQIAVLASLIRSMAVGQFYGVGHAHSSK